MSETKNTAERSGDLSSNEPPQASKEPWWTMTIEEVAEKLATDPIKGLDSKEAEERLKKYGLNELRAEEKKPKWKVFLEQFQDTLIYILIIAAIVSALMGEMIDALVIAIIVILNAIIGYIQEGKADTAIEALKNYAAPEATLIREGKQIKIKAREIVPGDILVLNEGDKIAADGRLIEQKNFKAEEAALTGESVPVNKETGQIKEVDCPLAERKNMVYASTICTYGRGKAIVTETGMNTEVGKIAELISSTEEQLTPLQKSLEEFGAWLGKIILYICFLVFLFYGPVNSLILYLRHVSTTIDWATWSEAFLNAIALAVAAIPEGLPAVVTTCLAIGVTRMSKRNAIIKKLHSVETLGCTSVICSDKTGTLTKNEMTVRNIWAGNKLFELKGAGYSPEGEILKDGTKLSAKDDKDLEMTLRIGMLCNNAKIEQESKTGKWNCFGDPTEGCLITSAWKGGLKEEELNELYPRVDELPFDSTRKRMSTINKTDGKLYAYIKGATELLLELSSNIQINGEVRPITQEDKDTILKTNNELAAKALRGLGFAYRPNVDGLDVDVDVIEKDLTFVGMQFMIDPPRDEVKPAIQECYQAGIKVKMITGDNLITATAIAEELNIIKKGDPTHEGKDIDQMTDQEVGECNVFARVSPEHKQKIVTALQNLGEIVAMTGDGVNDAPALKKADVGVAMGITGTDVTKEAAVMVLADDNFATIVAAVEEGRGIYDNIKKFILYLLSSNIMEVLVLFIAAILNMFIEFEAPLIAVQLLWINLATDGAPAVSLGADPYDDLLMKQKPRPIDEPILTHRFVVTMVYRGVVLTIFVLGLFYIYYEVPPFKIDDYSEITNTGYLGLAFQYDNPIIWKDITSTTWQQYIADPSNGLSSYTDYIDKLGYYFANPSAMPDSDFSAVYKISRETLARSFNLWHARSVTFLVMMFTEMANAYNCRSEYNSIFKVGWFTNKSMTYSVGISVILTIVMYIPNNGLGFIFKVIPLTWEWIWVPIGFFITIFSVEILKFKFRKDLGLDKL
ncbi:MAG: cation-translocating P-type ATPase [Promethearchaeota archaeon]